MRDYGKVQTTFWTSQDTSGMSETGRMLALYMLTSPHSNLLGCFHLPIGYVCEDLKWDTERVEQGFVELNDKGFATRDNGSKWVVMHSYLKWNPIENPNQGISAGRLFEQIPNQSAVKPLLVLALRKYSKHFPTSILDGLETVPKPFSNQEQEQEQEQEQDQQQKQDKPAPRKAKAPAAPSFDPKTDLLSHGVAEQTIVDWLALRTKKRAPVTPTVLSKLVEQAALAGMTLDATLALCCVRGWTGFEAAWVQKDARSGPPGAPAKFNPTAHVNRNRNSKG